MIVELVYSLIVKTYGLIIQLAAVKSEKAALWVNGRSNWQEKIKLATSDKTRPVIWIHASSTGEFEQGRTVVDQLRSKYKNHKIILTFFSPSGYTAFHDYEQVDHVFYLPLDSRRNARAFIGWVQPEVAIFVKYEFWLFYYQELAENKIPLYLVSAKMTSDHLFFKWYGKAYRKVLRLPEHFFVQDVETADLLGSIGLNNVTITGDTRVDRVLEVMGEPDRLPKIEQFLNGEQAIIAGSTWKAEDEFLSRLTESHQLKTKLIIAPHELNERKMNAFIQSCKLPVLRYSSMGEKGGEQPSDYSVLLIDKIGILKQVYQYGKWALIGGGFSDGIHNILEPAVFGVPAVFGPKYHKFVEAKDLLRQNGAICVNDWSGFERVFNELENNPSKVQQMAQICRKYIDENAGATQKVVDKLSLKLNA